MKPFIGIKIALAVAVVMVLESSTTPLNKFDYLPTSTTKQIIHHDYYSLSYNEKYEQAEWVAYELKKSELLNGTFKRPKFIADPKVTTQSASWKNYKKSGFDKGHLCPAGDREFTKHAFDETFYTSNISPQRHNFNNGSWKRLEEQVRSWAVKYEDIYVVTGGILKPNLPSIGFEKVAVPDYFYKILLDESDGKYNMIAFILPHKKSDAPLYTFVTSVDEIEKQTGIDFFPALPNDIENKLEAKSDYKAWSFSK